MQLTTKEKIKKNNNKRVAVGRNSSTKESISHKTAPLFCSIDRLLSQTRVIFIALGLGNKWAKNRWNVTTLLIDLWFYLLVVLHYFLSLQNNLMLNCHQGINALSLVKFVLAKNIFSSTLECFCTLHDRSTVIFLSL